ncbi:hypothetical protein [Beijerinckia sp. L45]|uniref:hypothetical protein n=1 Tax=Beijerinckia sp. L45 TaxID=1641855 RepID=UPI00131C0C9E|nr:hypothetical protein [Beijerinckia sp. L45]
MKTIAVVAALTAIITISSAQAETSSQGTSAESNSQNDVTKIPSRAVLPAAGGGSGNGAPGMQADCQKNPASCSDPVKSGAASSPGLPAQSK